MVIFRESGLSMLATILTLMIFSLFLAVLVSVVSTGSMTGASEERGVQAFYIAEGGMQYALMNVPNCSTNGGWRTLYSGSYTGEFRIDTPAYLTANISPGDIEINVDSTSRFPDSGRLTIGDDFTITYTGRAANKFTGAVVTQPHLVNDSVYPASALSATVPADPSCSVLPSINVDEDTGAFVIPGAIFIDNEFFYCTGKTANQFKDCQRCYKGSLDAAHPIPNRYAAQYNIVSTGRIPTAFFGDVRRIVQADVGPQ